MDKFKGVLLASDYDGTLLGSDRAVSMTNRDAITYFMGEGGIFTVATGRVYNAFCHQYDCSFINAPVILGNGAVIFDFEKQRETFESFLPDAALADFYKIRDEFKDLAFEVYCNRQIYAHRPNLITKRHLERVMADCEIRELEDIPAPWSSTLLEGDPDRLKTVQAYIEKNMPGLYEVSFSGDYLLEVIAKGTDKGAAVMNLSKRLGIKAENVYTIGDNENDVPMLKAAYRGFAPENAVNAAKEAAWKIVSSCDCGAVADVIKCLDEMY